MDARISPELPASGILHLQFNVGGQVWLQVQPFEKMDIIPALSFCNPARVVAGQLVPSPRLSVWGHRDGTASEKGHLLMTVASNECVFRELEDYYIEPPGDPFVLTVGNMDEEWKPWNIPCTKDPHTLFQIEYTGGPGQPDLITSKWRIYEDQSKLLSQCAAVCPSLKSAMSKYPESTIDMFLPQDIPT